MYFRTKTLILVCNTPDPSYSVSQSSSNLICLRIIRIWYIRQIRIGLLLYILFFKQITYLLKLLHTLPYIYQFEENIAIRYKNLAKIINPCNLVLSKENHNDNLGSCYAYYSIKVIAYIVFLTLMLC